jgi:hypothetical protein
MLIASSLIILGFTSLIFGANWLVNGASSLAKKNNVSDLVIGLTIVAFGTSAPELVVNSVASYDGLSDIVFGSIVGSNNFNLFYNTRNRKFNLSDYNSIFNSLERNTDFTCFNNIFYLYLPMIFLSIKLPNYRE